MAEAGPGADGLVAEVVEEVQNNEPQDGVLRMRGLPFTATVEQVQEFWEGFKLKEVVLGKRHGRSSGEAYVQLEDPDKAAEAMEQKQRQMMGPRYIEIFACTPAQLEAARTLSERSDGFVIRMRGLPYSSTSSEVLRFLEGLEVVRGADGVVFTHLQDGRPSGECFVELKDEPSREEALRRDKKVMGTRYVEVFSSTKADLIRAIKDNRLIAYRRAHMMRSAMPMYVGQGAYGMRGMPGMGFPMQGMGRGAFPMQGFPGGRGGMGRMGGRGAYGRGRGGFDYGAQFGAMQGYGGGYSGRGSRGVPTAQAQHYYAQQGVYPVEGAAGFTMSIPNKQGGMQPGGGTEWWGQGAQVDAAMLAAGSQGQSYVATNPYAVPQ